MTLRVHGGRILPENQEEAIRAAFAGKGQIEITGFDDLARGKALIQEIGTDLTPDELLATLRGGEEDPLGALAKRLAASVEAALEKKKQRLLHPFEEFTSQLGLVHFCAGGEPWLRELSRVTGKTFYCTLCSQVDDSVWGIEGDGEEDERTGATSTRYWLSYIAENPYEIPDRYGLHFGTVVGDEIKIGCEARGKPWPHEGYSLANLECKILGRKHVVVSSAYWRGSATNDLDWEAFISDLSAPTANSADLAGTIRVVHDVPEAFGVVIDGRLRKFLGAEGGRSSKSRLYRFLRALLRSANERSILLGVGKAAGVPETLLPQDGDHTEASDLSEVLTRQYGFTEAEVTGDAYRLGREQK